MEVPRLGVQLELQLPAIATATATPDPSCVSLWQHQIPDPLSKARDQTSILMDTSWIYFCCATEGTPCHMCLHTPEKVKIECSRSAVRNIQPRLNFHIAFYFFLSSFFFFAVSTACGSSQARDGT